jgi:prepilin-type N-terminal cleavage/methylation domain-containing protein/prepilin-type processing-associated H-X9-DG protein
MTRPHTIRGYWLNSRPSAFTLVELLVVMAIISMLMSILLPSLNKAREAGQRVCCLSNLRQLTLSWVMYTSDNEDRLCSPNTGWQYSGSCNWVADGPDFRDGDPQFSNAMDNPEGGTPKALEKGVLWPYVNSVPVYKCKSDRVKHLRSYAMSRTTGTYLRNMTDLSQPSEKMVFGELNTIPSFHWIVVDYWPIFRGAWQGDWRHPLAIWHGNGANFSFVDTHCEYLKWKDMRTVQWNTGKMSPEEAVAGTNVDFERMMKMLGYTYLGDGQSVIK